MPPPTRDYAAEAAALGRLDEYRSSDEDLKALFHNTLLVPSPGLLSKHMKAIKAGTADLKKEATGAAKAALSGTVAAKLVAAVRGQIKQALMEILDATGVDELLGLLGQELIAAAVEALAEAAPYLGIAKSGASTLVSGLKVISSTIDTAVIAYRKSLFAGGKVSLAVGSLQIIVARELTGHTIDVARHGSALGLKIGGLFADFGTATTVATGFANALIGLVKALVQAAIDFRDCKAGNEYLLGRKPMSVDMLRDCPVLGCYYLGMADTSTLARFLTGAVTQKGFTDDMTAQAKKMQGLLEQAAKAISKSRFVLIVRGDGVPKPVVTHIKYASYGDKARDWVLDHSPFAKTARAKLGVADTGDAARNMALLKGKVAFEAMTAAKTQVNNFMTGVAAGTTPL